jgi:hypothetical protein
MRVKWKTMVLRTIAACALGMTTSGVAYTQELPATGIIERAAIDAARLPLKSFTLPTSAPTSGERSWKTTVEISEPCETCPPTTNRNAPWQFSARLGYATAGGFELTAGMVGNRGYTLPTFMDTTIGGLKRLSPNVSALANLGSTIRWDVTVSGSGTLRRRSDSVTLGIVGDLFVPLTSSTGRSGGPTPSVPTASSSTKRLGLTLGY